ncbi:YdcF family protein [Sphingomonas adhaesiva]|uniref:YdcF family protein n=1 Tax=Sphingomonas adhaesiva TaxID=28212 RepID=UPI002FFA68CE
MIRRIAALGLLAWALGFVAFMLLLPGPADPGLRTDAIVVPTGAAGRIARGLELLEAGRAQRMLVTGTAPGVTRADLIRVAGHARTIACCVDLGADAVDTRGNAEETAAWLAGHRYRSIRLVTSDWHARRARLELASALDDGVTIAVDGVPSFPTLGQAFNEYNKLLLRAAAIGGQAVWRHVPWRQQG